VYKKLRYFLQQFVEISDDDFDLFSEFLVEKKVEKNDFLTRAGETEEYIYFLEEGLIHQFFLKGREVITIELVSEGTIINAAVSFLSGNPSNYSLQALESSILFGLSKKNLEYLYTLDNKWQRMGRLMISYYLIRQERTMIDNIRLSMRDRFLQFAINNPELMKRVPQHRLASYLNIKPETFTRLKPLLKNIKRP
jgi:CRP-like cAMP-binding protein